MSALEQAFAARRAAEEGVGRRHFLKCFGAGGAFMVGIGFLPSDVQAQSTGAANAGEASLSAFVRIAKDNTITIIIPSSEMGQGVFTALAMVLADELDADWRRVRVEAAPAGGAYKNLLYGLQLTGGSTTVRSFWDPMAKAGATVRHMLLAAAARQWAADPSDLITADGFVVQRRKGRRASFGELAALAATMPVPPEVTLKAPIDRKLVGRRLRRLDVADKVRGKPIYAMDVQLPGLLVALMAMPPVRGSTVVRADQQAALSVPGVVRVVPFSNGLAVLAKDFWTAKKGRDALAATIEWSVADMQSLGSDALAEKMKLASQTPGLPAASAGDADKVLAATGATGGKVFEAEYEVPYIAHACMEPMNTTAWVRPDAVEIWSPTQFQFANVDQCAKVGGVKPEQVKVHTTMLGGGFGRRFGSDFVQYALEVSKAAQVPVRLVYTREDDMRAHFYRPAQFARLQATVDGNGRIQALKARLVSSSIFAAAGFPLDKSGLDPSAVEGIPGSPYSIPNLAVEWVRYEPGPHVWFWRSVGHSQNAFVMEAFIDELARSAGRDPVHFRLDHLADKPRHANVLIAAAKLAGWGQPVARGHALGVALHESFETIVAQVAEVSVHEGQIVVHRVASAVDLGRCINPATVEAQVQSSVATGLSQALHMKISFKDGRVEQSNFHDHPVLRFAAMPRVDVVVIESGEKPGGMGEPATPPVAPAVANALAALGKPQRAMPFAV